MSHKGRTVVGLIASTDDIVVVDKPAGVTVVPARGQPPEASLHHRLQDALGERLWVVHRLDRDTSGAIVFARNPDAHRALSLAFDRREVRKTYVAFAGGRLEPSGRIDVALHPARRGKMRPARDGEPGRRDAATDYEVEAGWTRDGAHVSRLLLCPLEGRQHQIRVHLRWAGAPVLFDRLYATAEVSVAVSDAPCRRLALHAWSLELPGRPPLEAPLPADLVELEAWLDASWERVRDGTPG